MRQVSPAATPCQVSRQAINTIRLIIFSYISHGFSSILLGKIDDKICNYFNDLTN